MLQRFSVKNFKNFKISAKFDLADLIAGAAPRVKLKRS